MYMYISIRTTVLLHTTICEQEYQVDHNMLNDAFFLSTTQCTTVLAVICTLPSTVYTVPDCIIFLKSFKYLVEITLSNKTYVHFVITTKI